MDMKLEMSLGHVNSSVVVSGTPEVYCLIPVVYVRNKCTISMFVPLELLYLTTWNQTLTFGKGSYPRVWIIDLS